MVKADTHRRNYFQTSRKPNFNTGGIPQETKLDSALGIKLFGGVALPEGYSLGSTEIVRPS